MCTGNLGVEGCDFPQLLFQVFAGYFSFLLQMLGVRLDKTQQIPAPAKVAPGFIVPLFGT